MCFMVLHGVYMYSKCLGVLLALFQNSNIHKSHTFVYILENQDKVILNMCGSRDAVVHFLVSGYLSIFSFSKNTRKI